MATSGTRSYILNRDKIIAAMYRKCHLIGNTESPSSSQITVAQEILNNMVLSWQNDGIFLWTVTEEYAKLTANTNYVTLDSDTLEVRDVRFYEDETETPLTQLTREEYKAISNKADAGVPTSFYMDYQLAAPVMYLHPVYEHTTGLVTGTDALEYYRTNDGTSATATDKPITGTDYDDYWAATTLFGSSVGTYATATAYYSGHIRFTKIIRLQDFAASANNPDFPVRFYNALIYGGAVHLAIENNLNREDYKMLMEQFALEYGKAMNANQPMMGFSVAPRLG